MKSASNTSAILALCSALSLASPVIMAEEMKKPVMSQADRQSVDLPRSGQSMQSVEAEFGYPARVSGPVGSPPITIWDYQGYSVYFENNTVIHAVLKPLK